MCLELACNVVCWIVLDKADAAKRLKSKYFSPGGQQEEWQLKVSDLCLVVDTNWFLE